MAFSIVEVDVVITQAPAPSTLQQTGALVSQGGTILSAQTYSEITEPSDLTALLPNALAITSIAWASTYGGLATVTTAAAHGVAVGEQFVTTIAGALPAGYNGTVLATSTGASTFTYYLPVNPVTTPAATPGTYTQKGVGELEAMVTTFFSQGSGVSVYVLELGAGEPNAGVSALTNFLNNSPQFFYAYLVPRSWDVNANYITLVNQYLANTAKTYFFTTTTLSNYVAYTSTLKSVFTLIENPQIGVWAQNALTAAVYGGGQVTLTTTSPHGIVPGQYFTIQGCTPVGYNGTWLALPGTTGSTIIYAVPGALGAISVEGTLQVSIYPATGIPATEFSLAAAFYALLNQDPSTTEKMTPFCYSYMLGVTPFSLQGTQATLAALSNASVNIVGIGPKGATSQFILTFGTTMDGNQMNFWYAVDWLQVQGALAVAATVISGANNKINPLWNNQGGINQLLASIVDIGGRALNYNVAVGTLKQTTLDQTTLLNNLNSGAYAGMLICNAIPFVPYNTANPNDYKAGLYKGLTMIAVPQLGFRHIIFNIYVSQFPSQA